MEWDGESLGKKSFSTNGIEYSAEDYVYVNPDYITVDESNGLRRAFVVCQLLEIVVKTEDLSSFDVKVRRFYRPEDLSKEKAYASDIRELYYSQDTLILPPEAIVGKCEVRKKDDMPLCREYPISDHIFFCQHLYDSSKGSLKQDDTLLRKKKGKGVESETNSGIVKPDEVLKEDRLSTLDIFAGCGGLSQGLEKAGVSETKWAIEYEASAGQAFRQNHPKSTVYVHDCSVILRAIMEKCGDQKECNSCTEVDELAAKLSEDEKSTLPLPGQVDFIIGGPPCQGFSGMNSEEISRTDEVQTFLSFVEYFRPTYVLMENVTTFESHEEGKTFQLTLTSLLAMNYQVRFGILEAGAYGVSQSCQRLFIWAAAAHEVLPEWPEPMHVFDVPELPISLPQGLHYAAVRSTASGAPFRSITVRDTIGDLPPVESGDSTTNKEYQSEPVSWFQKMIRGNSTVLTDHICKVMSEQDNIRCRNIPKRPGADWRDLPDIKVTLKTGVVADMMPWYLPKWAKSDNKWKGQYGRLDWQGNFPNSNTDPRFGTCFHPDQDRIVTVRECARSKGFPDSYEFSGDIDDKHLQIEDAVPPPLAFALGRKLKQVLRLKNSPQTQP